MNRIRMMGLMLVLGAFLLYSQQYQIQGTITNQADFPVKNLVAKLARAGHQATTDTAGNFLVSGSVDIWVANNGMRAATAPVPVFKNDRFIVNLPEKSAQVTVELYTVQGQRIDRVHGGLLGRGEHSIPIASQKQTGASMIVALVTVNNAAYKFKLLRNGSRTFSCCRERGNLFAENGLARSAGAPLDTLVIYRKDSVEYTIPITATSARYRIMLDLLPYEITEDVAIKEDRRGPEEVGTELRQQNIYPYDLWTYLTGPDDAWCSEFLAWAYRAAGYPMGSDEGTATRPRWLQKGNTGIRSWFQNTANKHEWVDRSSAKWETFVPVYGDFVRYDNSGGGHTGIVRYVNGTTMYTVEGNVSNSVRLRTITNYKSNSSLDGFGRRSGVRQDTHTQVF
ncbi:MAG: CHAP domain-containing protein [Chitinispirillaceae bacterium]|nr:CHAP domain-containing protein [Chitinispirillaceae bacterium]